MNLSQVLNRALDWQSGDVGRSLGSFGEYKTLQGFPGGTVVKNPPANAGNTGLSPGPGRSHMPRSN